MESDENCQIALPVFSWSLPTSEPVEPQTGTGGRLREGNNASGVGEKSKWMAIRSGGDKSIGFAMDGVVFTFLDDR